MFCLYFLRNSLKEYRWTIKSGPLLLSIMRFHCHLFVRHRLDKASVGRWAVWVLLDEQVEGVPDSALRLIERFLSLSAET